MASSWFQHALLTILICFARAQRGTYYSQVSAGNGNVQLRTQAASYTPPQVYHAERRADTCGPESTCMFALLCLVRGGAVGSACPGGLLSACCTFPGQTAGRRYVVPPAGLPVAQAPKVDTPAVQNSYAVESKPANGNVTFCGIATTKPQSRIIGGDDAMYGEFPWQAHIKLNRQQCGGVLLNNYYVLTAAHCIHQVKLADITIQLGVYDIQDHSRQEYKPQTFSVVEKKVHPNFKYQAAHPDRYDVALLKLDRPARYQENVVPICLPRKDWNFKGWKGIITGWGKTDGGLSNRYGTRLLQKVDVPIITNEQCERWHQEKGIDITISPEMMCAGYEEGKKDACVGDSGGPLMVTVQGRWTVVGLVSAGFGCAQSRQPGIYHRVPYTVDWLRQSILS